MTDEDKLRLCEAASILRLESRNYYDSYKRTEDSRNKYIIEMGRKDYEKYMELNRIASELDIISANGGL